MKMKILVADDDAILRELLCDIILKEGYLPLEAKNGQEAIDLFCAHNDIALVILDVMMPLYDGWEVLKEIRQHSEVAIIMLTALGDEKHEISGLTRGANDYIAKPFSYEVLVARMNALLRKQRKESEAVITLGELIIHQVTHKLFISQEEIPLNRKEYNLLLYLVNNRNHVLTREQILENIWGYDFDGDIRTIDTHIKTLRSKLSACGEYLKTIRGTGYMFKEP